MINNHHLLSLLFLTSVLAQIYFLILTQLNIHFLKCHHYDINTFNGPLLSVLIPARNEEANIANCLESLINQSYQNYEVIVLNDNSTDKTPLIIDQFSKQYKHIRHINGQPLAPGWYGKPYAMQQLLNEANGELVMFIDADTTHHPNALSFSVSQLINNQVDMISAYTYHRMDSLGEKIILPVFYIMMAMILPFILITKSQNPRHSFAIGAYMLYRQSALKRIGGFELVKNEVNEDIIITRLLKKANYKTLFIDAKQYVTTWNYRNFKEAFHGVSKNIFAGVDKNIIQLLGSLCMVSMIIVGPFILLIDGLITHQWHLIIFALPIAIFTVMWAQVLHNRGQSRWMALLYPAMFFVLITMAIKSSWQTLFGKGINWKSRLVK